MTVRIRLQCGPRIKRKKRKNQRVALALAALLNPAAVAAFALATWKLAADLGTARQFVILNGLFSHWQVWAAIVAALKTAAIFLNRYGDVEALQNSEPKTSRAVLNSGF